MPLEQIFYLSQSVASVAVVGLDFAVRLRLKWWKGRDSSPRPRHYERSEVVRPYGTLGRTANTRITARISSAKPATARGIH
jgi:hypothetical protein